jgi:KUP system potassium uptake protein
LGVLSLAALGVVYGDIGTSPLYAMHAVFGNDRHPVPVDPANILGVLSLVFWSLVIVVTLKYVTLILRADNRGEGGIMALIALVQRRLANQPVGQRLILLGLFGAALFCGEGIITPAISVLSAVEGLEMVASDLDDWVIPSTLVILFGLFAVQRHGTGRMGNWFGPIMTVWFLTLGALGIGAIVESPGVLEAVSPTHAFTFFAIHPVLAFFSLGSVVLAITGSRHCMRIWAISVAPRCGWPGAWWCSRPWSSTTSARVHSCWPSRTWSATPFSAWPLVGR